MLSGFLRIKIQLGGKFMLNRYWILESKGWHPGGIFKHLTFKGCHPYRK